VNQAAGRRLRLFFALWPSDACRAALVAAAAPVVAVIAGNPVPPGNLHATLVFLGSVPGGKFARLVEAGGRVPWPAIDLDFDRLEYWSRAKVMVAMPSAVPASGFETVDRLWQLLQPLGFERESRPWQPHLTLVRRVRRPPPENLRLAAHGSAGPLPWRLALVESTAHPGGARYRTLADWPLGR